MSLLRILPLSVLLLAACSEPADNDVELGELNPGPDCEEQCAAGYRWALEEALTDPVKCRGENDFARGCRQAVAFTKPL